MTIQEIVKQWIRVHNHEGLWNEDGPCGCGLDDFAPCGGPIDGCHLAYKKGDEFFPIDGNPEPEVDK